MIAAVIDIPVSSFVGVTKTVKVIVLPAIQWLLITAFVSRLTYYNNNDVILYFMK